jgi:hypothetical protein
VCYGRNVVLCLCTFRILAFINSGCRCSQIIALYYRIGKEEGTECEASIEIVHLYTFSVQQQMMHVL